MKKKYRKTIRNFVFIAELIFLQLISMMMLFLMFSDFYKIPWYNRVLDVFLLVYLLHKLNGKFVIIFKMVSKYRVDYNKKLIQFENKLSKYHVGLFLFLVSYLLHFTFYHYIPFIIFIYVCYKLK